jgi:diguanylate cyclase (GGDEF)-like protein
VLPERTLAVAGEEVMPLFKDLREQLTGMLEWRAVDKGLIPLTLLVPIFASYLLWIDRVQLRPDRDLLIDVAVAEQLRFALWIMLTGATALVALGLAIRRRWPGLLSFEFLGTGYYAATMAYCGYAVGSTSFAAGIVVLGAPLIGFILLDRLPVLFGMAIAFGYLAWVSYQSAAGHLPYAPLMVPPQDAASRLFWLNSVYIMALPHILIILPLADRVLTWWREREATIRVLSRTDMLTGIHNRRSIIELLDKEVARSRRHGPPLSVVILDLDHFKKINDTWGHPTGDRVLQEAAKVLAGTIRQCDAIGRYGGEEFLLLLPDTTLDGAAVLVERCRAALARVAVTADSGETFSISGSFGLAGSERLAEFGTTSLIRDADAALYRAKEKGRNRVEVARAEA